MRFLDYLDRAGQRRHERAMQRGPTDYRVFVGVLFFMGYYLLVFALTRVVLPAENAPLVNDAMIVLGPVIGAIGQALFRSDKRDEIQASNTGEGFRALGKQAEATAAAASSSSLPAHSQDSALEAGDTVTLTKPDNPDA